MARPSLALRLAFAAALALQAANEPAAAEAILDMAGRTVEVSLPASHVICSGAGCLRLLVYLGAADLAVAVDGAERGGSLLAWRPYSLAHPRFRGLPLFGEFRGRDDAEKILALDPAPDVIFKVCDDGGADADRLQAKTGLPVVALSLSDPAGGRGKLALALRTMARVIGREARAGAVLGFLDSLDADLARRTAGIPERARPACYVAGVAMRGPRGFFATDPVYPPFALAGARNVAANLAAPDGGGAAGATIAREALVAADPDWIFLDASSAALGEGGGAFGELTADPLVASLAAVRAGAVRVTLPHNSYATNWGTLYANAYFIGKTLHPDRFADVDPAGRADAIYEFLVGARVFSALRDAYGVTAFAPYPRRAQ